MKVSSRHDERVFVDGGCNTRSEPKLLSLAHGGMHRVRGLLWVCEAWIYAAHRLWADSHSVESTKPCVCKPFCGMYAGPSVACALVWFDRSIVVGAVNGCAPPGPGGISSSAMNRLHTGHPVALQDSRGCELRRLLSPDEVCGRHARKLWAASH